MALFDFFGKTKAEQRKAEAEAEMAEEKKVQAEEVAARQKEEHKDFQWPVLPRFNVYTAQNQDTPKIEDPLSPEDKERIGSLIFEPKLTLDMLKDLNLQETMFLEASQTLANHQAPLENFQDNHQQIHNHFLTLVRGAEKIYILYDLRTGYPLLDMGCAVIYTEKEHADIAAEIYAAQLRKVRVIEQSGIDIPAEEKDGKTQMKFFDFLFFLGIENIMIDNGWYKGVLRRSEISAPFYLNEDPAKIPPYNPVLSFFLTDYVEELRWPVKYEKRDEMVRAKFQKVLEVLPKSVFVMPMRDMVVTENPETGSQDGAEDSSDEPKETHRIQLPMLTLNNKRLLPVFTDVFEFSKNFGNSPFRPVRMAFKDIGRFLGNYEGFIINPQGQAFVIEKKPAAPANPEEQAATKSHMTEKIEKEDENEQDKVVSLDQFRNKKGE